MLILLLLKTDETYWHQFSIFLIRSQREREREREREILREEIKTK